MNYPPFPSGEPAFVDDLRRPQILRPHWVTASVPSSGDADLRAGLRLKTEFPDPEGLLYTAEENLCRFLREAPLWNPDGIPVFTRQNSALSGETFRMTVATDSIRIESGELEGIRRGLYFLEEQLAAAPGPFLPLGETSRTMWLKNRISRCFFGPIKRPPFHHDELLDEINYYPDEYLNRLAREGVNGLWLTIEFREICTTSLFPRDPNAEKRLEKLRRTVRQCRRFGIRIWTFCIEPHCWTPAFPCPPEHPELRGPESYSGTSFCPKSETAQRYLRESAYSLFAAVPELGGLIIISLGERVTSCLSTCSISQEWRNPCDGKCNLAPDEILASVIRPMAEGMRTAAPRAELISWLYIPAAEQIEDWIYRLPEKLNHHAILALNFESGCTKPQLGKLRNGGDYWLSCVGPSERFGRMALAVDGHCSIAAKLQVCCSHETATIPFVPVPGQLYRKYAAMKRLGVEHVIQCWYFGNYPGLMNRAAGRLAAEPFNGTERGFLEELSAVDWGKFAPDMVSVLSCFSDAYANYPLDIQFQYYGPMHDGPVWPLHLKQVLRSLPRTWKPETEPAGDAIGECLRNHTLREAALLARKLSDGWRNGVRRFNTFRMTFAEHPDRRQDAALIDALDLQFQSGADILEFYVLRNRLLDSPPDSLGLLDQLETIVHNEIEVSRRLAELCVEDSRLGYHSEAEVFKYDPLRLRWRMDWLMRLLETDFAECREKLSTGIPAGEILFHPLPVHRIGDEYCGDAIRWKAETDGATVRFIVDCDGPRQTSETECLRFFLADRKAEFYPLEIAEAKRNGESYSSSTLAGFRIKDRNDGWRAVFEFPRIALGENFLFGILHEFRNGEGKSRFDSYPPGNFSNQSRLNLDYFAPDRMILFCLERC